MSGNAETARALFAQHFGAFPTLVVRAPGRVNLIGEHTDYNDGFVLPMAIDRHVWVAASANQSGRVRAVAGDFEGASADIDLSVPIIAQPGGGWINYVAGMVALLRDEGVAIDGADIAITADLPAGAGLSSSAALENGVGLALATLAGRGDLPRTRLAELGQLTEHRFAGCQCGIMDQLVSASAVAGHALLIDCRDLSTTPIAMPSDAAVLIVHSGVERGLVDGEYNARRAQCFAAAAHYGVKALRDITPGDVHARSAGLDPVTTARARHVVGENVRTQAAAKALIAADYERLGQLMMASHASLREDFEVTVPDVDRLTDLLQSAIGSEGGARMTGGGFGGAVVAVTTRAVMPKVIETLEARYRTARGQPAWYMVADAVGGVAVV
jgi:galactokinase